MNGIVVGASRLRARASFAAAVAAATVVFGGCPLAVLAQPPGPAAPPLPPRESAPIDLTGQWVAIVNEDWRWRMVTPPKGDYGSILTLNARGREVADQWEPSQDGSCRAYGAAGLLRMPTRLRIEWDGDDVLRLQTDAGQQTRLLRFAAPGLPQLAAAAPSLQGSSTAQWIRTLPGIGAMGFGAPGARPPPGGSLQVTTTNLSEGWLRRNGVPYSEQTVLNEFFDRFAAPNGEEWLVVTTIVADPVYHNGRFITSSHFKRESGNAKWNPRDCRAD